MPDDRTTTLSEVKTAIADFYAPQLARAAA